MVLRGGGIHESGSLNKKKLLKTISQTLLWVVGHCNVLCRAIAMGMLEVEQVS